MPQRTCTRISRLRASMERFKGTTVTLPSSGSKSFDASVSRKRSPKASSGLSVSSIVFMIPLKRVQVCFRVTLKQSCGRFRVKLPKGKALTEIQAEMKCAGERRLVHVVKVIRVVRIDIKAPVADRIRHERIDSKP